MAVAKRLKYEDMTPEQKAKAKRCAEKYGIPVEDVKMTTTGIIVLGKLKDPVADTKRQMVAKGWADSVAEITPSMYQEYIDSLDDEYEPVRLR